MERRTCDLTWRIIQMAQVCAGGPVTLRVVQRGHYHLGRHTCRMPLGHPRTVQERRGQHRDGNDPFPSSA